MISVTLVNIDASFSNLNFFCKGKKVSKIYFSCILLRKRQHNKYNIFHDSLKWLHGILVVYLSFVFPYYVYIYSNGSESYGNEQKELYLRDLV